MLSVVLVAYIFRGVKHERLTNLQSYEQLILSGFVASYVPFYKRLVKVGFKT